MKKYHSTKTVLITIFALSLVVSLSSSVLKNDVKNMGSSETTLAGEKLHATANTDEQTNMRNLSNCSIILTTNLPDSLSLADWTLDLTTTFPSSGSVINYWELTGCEDPSICQIISGQGTSAIRIPASAISVPGAGVRFNAIYPLGGSTTCSVLLTDLL